MLVVKPMGSRILPFQNLDGQFGDATDDASASVDTAAADSLSSVPGGDQAVTLGQALMAQEQSLWSSYQTLATLATSMPDGSIPSQAVDMYMDARTSFMAAAQDWVDAHQSVSATNPGALTDAGSVPIYPPSIISGVAVGANTPVQLSQMTVTYGPMGSEQQTVLADQTVWSFSPQARGVASGSGLGLAQFAILLIVGLVCAVAAIVGYFVTNSIIQSAQAKTAQAQAKAQVTSQALTAISNGLSQCASIQDATQRANCVTQGIQSLQATTNQFNAQEKAASTGLFNLGFLGTAGLVVLLAGLGIVGYQYLNRKKSAGSGLGRRRRRNRS
jgi:hypothetical protein